MNSFKIEKIEIKEKYSGKDVNEQNFQEYNIVVNGIKLEEVVNSYGIAVFKLQEGNRKNFFIGSATYANPFSLQEISARDAKETIQALQNGEDTPFEEMWRSDRT